MENQRQCCIGLEPGARALAFLDEKGQLRLGVGLFRDGAPQITMFDHENKERVVMVVDAKDNLPHLHLLGDDGKALVRLTVKKDGGPTFSIDQKDKGGIVASLSKNGEPSLYLYAKPDKVRMSLEVIDGAPYIRLFGANNVVKSRWTVSPDGSPTFSLLDGRSRERLSIGIDKNEEPFIRLNNPDKNASKTIR